MLDRMSDSYTPEAIGARIKRVREAWEYSQADLGEICEVGKNTVSHWEHGRQRPTIPQMHRLTTATGLTLDWIYLGREGGLPLDAARRLGLT